MEPRATRPGVRAFCRGGRRRGDPRAGRPTGDPGRPAGDHDHAGCAAVARTAGAAAAVSAPACRLRAADRLLELGGRSWLMGVVSAAPHRGASGVRDAMLQAQLDAARELLGAGADILEVDACPERAGVPAVDVQEQIEQVAPHGRAVAELCAHTGAALVLAPDRIDAALGAGTGREQLIVHAALDLAAT